MDEARFGLAMAAARLAETEGNTALLVEACRKLLGHYEQRLERMRRLVRMRAAHPNEILPIQDAVNKARDRLEAAERRLAEEHVRNDATVPEHGTTTRE